MQLALLMQVRLPSMLWRMLLKVKLLAASVDLVPRLKLCAAWRLESCRPPNAHDLLTRRL